MLYYSYPKTNSVYSLDENMNLLSCSLSSQEGVNPVTNDEDWVVVNYDQIDSNLVHTLKTIHNLLTVASQFEKSLFNNNSKTGLKDFYQTK